MSFLTFSKKSTKHTNRQKAQFAETEEASQSHSGMTEILELSFWEFKVTKTDVLRIKWKKIDM